MEIIISTYLVSFFFYPSSQEGTKSNARKAKSNETGGLGRAVLAACDVLFALGVEGILDTNADDVD